MSSIIKKIGLTVSYSAIVASSVVSSALAQSQGVLCGGGSTHSLCGGNSVPELDGAMGPLAMAILAGVIGIGLERRRRKDKTKI